MHSAATGQVAASRGTTVGAVIAGLGRDAKKPPGRTYTALAPSGIAGGPAAPGPRHGRRRMSFGVSFFATHPFTTRAMRSRSDELGVVAHDGTKSGFGCSSGSMHPA